MTAFLAAAGVYLFGTLAILAAVYLPEALDPDATVRGVGEDGR